MRREQGFTLVELMVAMVVGSIAIASAYASYDVIAKQYEKVKGVTAMQSSSRSIMRMIERDIRMAGFKWRDSKGTITYGSISAPIKITDSGNKCCDAVTVTYDYRDEASKKVERVQIRYWVADHVGSSGTRGRLFRKTNILGRNKKILPKPINGNDDVLADYVEDLQFSDGSLLPVYFTMRNYAKLWVYDVNRKQMVNDEHPSFPRHGADAMAFSPTGLLYFTMRNYAKLWVYDVNKKQMVNEEHPSFPRHGGDAMAFSPTGLLYFTMRNYAKLWVYDVNKKQMVNEEHPSFPRHGADAMAFSPTGLLYFTMRNYAKLWVYDVNKKQMVNEEHPSFPRHGGDAMAFSPTGLLYFTMRNYAKLWVYDVNKKQMVNEEHPSFPRHGGDAMSFNKTIESKGLIAIDLILRTKKQYGLDRNYAKKDHFGGNYDINKNDAYKRQEYSSTVLIRNPL